MERQFLSATIGRLVDGYFHLLKALIALCLAGMVVLVFGNVALRYLFNSGISVSEELSRWLFVWLTYLGAALALREHGHLGVDTLVAKLPRAGKKLCFVVAQALMLAISWLMLSGSWQQTVINMGSSAPTSGLPMGILHLSAVVFAATALAINAYELLRALFGQISDEELIMVIESEEQAEVKALQQELAQQQQQHKAAALRGEG